MSVESIKERAQLLVDSGLEQLLSLSHTIHAAPEIAFEEVRAASWIAEALTETDMEVEVGVVDLPTSVAARAGDGPLTLAVCAEYDALPGIGHACGHNVIAAAAVGAAVALRPLVDDLGITVKVFGTPAEESGGGKILMLERGAFDGVHAAMMIHPAPYESTEFPALAWQKFNVLYQGHAAHASMFPEQGINAADALTIAQVAIGLLRQHIGTGCQVHGIVTDGGDAANIIPGHAAGEFMARAMTLGELERELVPRLTRCFEAGALATGATVAMERSGPSYSEFRADPGLLGMYARNALAIGRRFQEGRVRSGGSTDMANVSLALPAIHPMMNINSGGAGNHQPEFAAAAVTPDADKVVRDGAIAMAWTIIDTATDVAQRSRLLKLQDGAAN